MEKNTLLFVKAITILSIFFLLGIISCLQNSVLSDIKITDPSILKVEIKLQRIISENGSMIQGIEAWIYDRKENLVGLKNDEIYVNKCRMVRNHVLISNAPYYRAPDNVSFEIDSSYEFSIVLADNSECIFFIRTQKQNIHKLVIPINFSRHDSLVVSWVEKDTSGNLFIKYNMDWISIKNASSGTYVFPPDRFDTTYKSVNIQISSEKYGNVDSSFMDGSKIISTIRLEHAVKIID